MPVCTGLETTKSYQTSCYIPLGSRASYCRSRRFPPICTLRALSFRQVEPTCPHKRRERSSHNQTEYSFVQRDTPSHLVHNPISLHNPTSLHHPNLTHQWISSLHFSPLKVSLTLPSLSPLSSPPVPFPLTWRTIVVA
jgi:hypothetical protein